MEWEPYKVGPAPRGSSTRTNCRPFDHVGHVCHTDTALQIIRDGKIRAGSIRDKSLLTGTSTTVSWMSPNDWHQGSHYGNVRLWFDFKTFASRMRAYWVEVVTDYNPTACRLLLTSHRRDDLPEYDPEVPNGPWWFDRRKNQHYFNDKFCLEFMIEEDVDLADLHSIDFVNHHRRICAMHRKTPRNCCDLGESAGRMGAKFLICAASGAVDLSIIASKLVDPDDPDRVSIAIAHGVSYVLRRFSVEARSRDFSGTVRGSGKTAQALGRAMLHAASIGQHSEMKRIAALFIDEEAATRAAANVIAETLQFDDADHVYRKMT